MTNLLVGSAWLGSGFTLDETERERPIIKDSKADFTIPLRNSHFKAGKPGKRDPGEDSRWRQPDAPEATSYYSPIQTKPKPARKLLLLPFPVSRTKPKLGQASSQATTTIARQASYTCISSSRWNTKFWPLWSWSSQMFQIQAFVVEVKSPSLGLEIKNLILGMNNF